MLFEIAEETRKRRGINSIGRYVTAVVLADILRENRDRILKEAANAPPGEQDQILAYLLTFPVGKTKLLEWIEQTIEVRPGIFRDIT